MAKHGFKVLDAEPHFLEPHDLWEQNLPEPFRSKTTVSSSFRGRIGEGALRPQVAGLDRPPAEAEPLVRRRALRRVPLVDHLAKVTGRPEPDLYSGWTARPKHPRLRAILRLRWRAASSPPNPWS